MLFCDRECGCWPIGVGQGHTRPPSPPKPIPGRSESSRKALYKIKGSKIGCLEHIHNYTEDVQKCEAAWTANPQARSVVGSVTTHDSKRRELYDRPVGPKGTAQVLHLHARVSGRRLPKPRLGGESLAGYGGAGGWANS